MLLQEPGHRHQHVVLYLQTTITAFTLNNLTTASLPQEDEVLPLAVPNGGLVEGKEGGAGRTELGRVLEEMK